MVPEIWCTKDGQTDGQRDGQTDGWKKRHKEVGVPPKNQIIAFGKMLRYSKVIANIKYTDFC